MSSEFFRLRRLAEEQQKAASETASGADNSSSTGCSSSSPPSSSSAASEDSRNSFHTNRKPYNGSVRCRYFPRCIMNNCGHVHPKTPCRHQAACRYGRFCLFLHSPCLDDGRCREQSCPLEHYKQPHPCYLQPTNIDAEPDQHKEYARLRIQHVWKEMGMNLSLSPLPEVLNGVENTHLSCFVKRSRERRVIPSWFSARTSSADSHALSNFQELSIQADLPTPASTEGTF